MTLAVAFARVMILKNGPGASKNVDGAEVSFRASESGPNDAMTGPAVEEELVFDRRYRKGLTHATKQHVQAVASSPCAMTTPERAHESHPTCHDRRATLCWL